MTASNLQILRFPGAPQGVVVHKAHGDDQISLQISSNMPYDIYIYNIAILEDGQKNPCHRSWFTSWFDDRYGHSNGFYNDLSYHISYIHVFPYLFMIDNPYLLVSMIFMFFPMILPYLLVNNPHLLDSTGWGPPDISWCINHDNPHELARYIYHKP